MRVDEREVMREKVGGCVRERERERERERVIQFWREGERENENGNSEIFFFPFFSFLYLVGHCTIRHWMDRVFLSFYIIF